MDLKHKIKVKLDVKEKQFGKHIIPVVAIDGEGEAVSKTIYAGCLPCTTK